MKSFELPEGARVLGFVVHLPDSDEFLVVLEDSPDATLRMFVKGLPGYAKIYEKMQDAEREAAQCKQRAVVCLLAESESEFYVSLD